MRSGWPRHLYAGTHSFGFALLDTGTYSYKVIPGKSTFITLFLALIKKIGHGLDSLDTVDIVIVGVPEEPPELGHQVADGNVSSEARI